MYYRTNTLANPSVKKRFMRWLEKNIENRDDISRIDPEEFGHDLTFGEAIDLAVKKFPMILSTFSPSSKEARIKQIVFIRPLLEKILSGEVRVSYRRTQKLGYYYVIDSRFKKPRPKIIVEFYRSETVDPSKLTDRDAQLAGVHNATILMQLLTKWYGFPLPKLYRNWLRIVEKVSP